MSYAGATSVGPFLQGLSTSSVNDTWSANIIDYTPTNFVTTLQNGLVGDWRINPHVESSSGWLASYRPNNSTTEYALFGSLASWTGGALCKGDESVLSVDSSTCGFFFYQKSGTLAWTYNYERWSTICEVL